MEAEESSAKRRERLLALRSAAAAAAAASNPATTPPPPPSPSPAAAAQLPDSLFPSPAAPSQPPPSPSHFSPRFDYYTNPAAAFSGSKRKSSGFHHTPRSAHCSPPPFAGPGNYTSNFGHPPHQQHHMAGSPGQSPFEMAPDAQQSSPWHSPMHFQTPMSGYRGTPPSGPPPWHPSTASPPQGNYPNPSRFGFTSSNLGQGGTPVNPGPRGSSQSYYGQGRGQHYSSSPGPRGSPQSYSGQGRGQHYSSSPGQRDSPQSYYGRGRGQQYGSSPASRGSGGRGGLGSQNHHEWQDRRSYYRSMVEDPWQDMQPIVGNILIPRDGSKSWLPESLSVKKGKSDQGASKLNSDLSLAEYLEMSFNETTGET